MKDIKEFFRTELEHGTYFLNGPEIYGKLKEVFEKRASSREWDQEVDHLSLELLAGLAVFHFGEYEKELERLLRDPTFSAEAKIKGLGVIRHHFLDPDHVLAGLRLYPLFLNANEPGLRDFAARSFLQLLTEMRVVGGMGGVLRDEGTKGEIRRILKELSARGWMEADELLDLLEL